MSYKYDYDLGGVLKRKSITCDDLTLLDDLVVTDDATVSGDLAVTGSVSVTALLKSTVTTKTADEDIVTKLVRHDCRSSLLERFDIIVMRKRVR